MTSYHKKQETPTPSDYKYPPRKESQTTKQRDAMSQDASKTKPLESSEPEPPPAPVAVEASTNWKEDEVDGIQRKVKRYRMIEELYAATEKVVPASSGGRKQKQTKK